MIALINPRDPWNLANIIRVVSNFEYDDKIIYTGNNINNELDIMDKLPRPMRSKHYKNVIIEHVDKIIPIDNYTPVCIEIDGSIDLQNFTHPKKAIYIFGPENGCVPSHIKRFCHYVVKIQTNGCLNLSHAVTCVLYDRSIKQ